MRNIYIAIVKVCVEVENALPLVESPDLGGERQGSFLVAREQEGEPEVAP